MPPTALLLVFSEPGDNVPLPEFHDWYDNEHVPLRVDTPAFLSWARVEEVDGKSPRWGAYYDLTSYDDTQKAPYTTLAETRSEREKSILFVRAKHFQRRTYEVYEGASILPPSPLFDPNSSAPVVIFRSLEVKPEAEEDFHKWINEEHIPLLSKCPGWIRSRRFVLRESAKVGVDGPDPNPPPKYLAIHEWTDLEGIESAEFKKAIDTEWRSRVMANVGKT
ncbi:hypothetical protein NLI96_g3029 [Meripilus lineatus]|uniref:Uncharacterized protein n=1 Tax=Meripilus lineatus TaxID=2056292 RepID=A0AAD5V9Q8_9APHY|nr:hypothetical protein NLI96_g3029 [Physisporinus lineatus]